MFLNNAWFASDEITILLHLVTHLKPPSSENILLANNDLNRLEILLGESSIDYINHIRGISQRLQGISMNQIIPLLPTTRLDHDRYPGIKIRYLAFYPALINCNLLGLSGLFNSEKTHQQALGLPTDIPRVMEKRKSNVTAPPPITHRNPTCPGPPTGTCPSTDYPHVRGVPWKSMMAMICTDLYCIGCHFNKPDESPRLKVHQEVGCLAIAMHGYICKNNVA